MAVTRQKKQEVLDELKIKFADAKSVAFVQYEGLSVADMTQLRGDLRKADVELTVAKKTLFKLAAKEQKLELPNEIMMGTVAAICSKNDPVAGPRIVKQSIKKMEVLKLLGGMMDGQIFNVKQMNELADLPSREQLLAKFMGMMQSPLQSFHGMISAPLGSFARALDAYAKQKEGSAT